MDYNEFCNKYEHFARDLCLLGQEAGAELKMPEEDPLYNAGVMSRYMDGQIASNITLVNGQQVKNGFESVKKAYPEMSDDELRARLVFMVLQARGSDLSYEKTEMMFCLAMLHEVSFMRCRFSMILSVTQIILLNISGICS